MSCMFTSNKPLKQSQSHSVLTQYHWPEAATGIIFLVATKVCLPWQNFCHNKHILLRQIVAINNFVATKVLRKDVFCRNKRVLVATNTCLLRQIFIVTNIILLQQKFCAKLCFVAINTCLILCWQWYSNTRKRNTANCTLSVYLQFIWSLPRWTTESSLFCQLDLSIDAGIKTLVFLLDWRFFV